MQFIKMQGAGNDYVYIDAFREAVNQPEELARRVSHRHFGIGSDGLILIKNHDGADGEMEMYNSDGSRSEMCGNGLRCVAKYLHDTYARGRNELRIQTGAGLRTASIVGRDTRGMANRVCVDMGEPTFQGLDIPTVFDEPAVLRKPLEIAGRKL